MLNDIKLHGRLGRDPHIEEFQGNNGPYKRVDFSLAVDRDFGDGVDWFYCTMTGKRAEVIEKFFRKGSEIILSGRMESYKPKNDPNRTAWLVKMTGFDFVSGNRNGSETSQTSGTPEGFEEMQDDDVPF